MSESVTETLFESDWSERNSFLIYGAHNPHGCSLENVSLEEGVCRKVPGVQANATGCVIGLDGTRRAPEVLDGRMVAHGRSHGYGRGHERVEYLDLHLCVCRRKAEAFESESANGTEKCSFVCPFRSWVLVVGVEQAIVR